MTNQWNFCGAFLLARIFFFLIAALGIIKKNYAERALQYNGPEASFKILLRTYSTK